MLRAYTLTLPAADAIAGFPGACSNQVVIEHFRAVIFFIQPCGIECPENVGDAYRHGAAITAVAAGCTLDHGHILHFLHNGLDHLLLLFCQRFKISECIQVICHLFLGRHTA